MTSAQRQPDTPASARNAPAGVPFYDAAAARAFIGSARQGPSQDELPLAGMFEPPNEPAVQAVVAWANEHGHRLLLVSSPHGLRRFGATGVTAPVYLLNLSHLKKTRHVSGRDGIAIIEAGVTFEQLDADLKPHGLRAMRPFMPRKGKSVLACFLEREPTLSPNEHWDTTDPLAAMSMVMGSGASFRTGGAAIPGELEDNLARGNRQMMSLGPVATDYSRVVMGAQGSLAVVCWSSVYCEKIPALEDAHLFGCDEVAPLLKVVRELTLRKIGLNVFLLNKTQLAAAVADQQSDVNTFLGTNPAPEWLLYVNLGVSDFRPEEALAWQRSDLLQAAKDSGVEDVSQACAQTLTELQQRLFNAPAQHYKSVPRDHCADVFCLTQMSNVPRVLRAGQGVLDRLNAAGNHQMLLGAYVQPTIQGVSAHVEFSCFYDATHAALVREAEPELLTALTDAGGFLSRPYGAWSDHAYALSPDIVPHLKRTKNLLDPNAVLAPGRLCY